MEVPTSEDASSANFDLLKMQIAKLHMNASRKVIVKLLESLRQLIGKVKDLADLHFDPLECNNNKELINHLLTENAKVEKILLEVSSSTRRKNFCITEKPAKNISQEEKLESVTEEKLEATSEVGKDSSEQLTNVKELRSDENVQIAQMEQVTNDLPHINMAPENKEETLESVQQEINRQLEETNTAVAKLKLDVEQTKSELAERKTELEDFRQQNSELYTEFETANKNIQNAEDNLKKVKSQLHKQLLKKWTLRKQNDCLSVTVSPEEASEDSDEELEM